MGTRWAAEPDPAFPSVTMAGDVAGIKGSHHACAEISLGSGIFAAPGAAPGVGPRTIGGQVTGFHLALVLPTTGQRTDVPRLFRP